MSGLELYTLSHVIISIVAIVAGIPVVAGFIKNKNCPGWTNLYLVMVFLTNAGGFIVFPFEHVLPSHIIAALALVLLIVSLAAKFAFKLQGIWRTIYVLSMLANLFFLFFVLIAQGFQKIPFLHALAPTQSEPPFAVAQLVLLVIFVFAGIQAKRGYQA